MLLKSITLKDFRNFIGTQTVTFSDDPDRNVTVIMGENGAGKTTFAQAFTWCLYGETGFTDKMVMSKAVLQTMSPNDVMPVSVEIVLRHNNTDYYIRREQEFRRDYNGQVKPLTAKLTVRYKGKDGQQEFVSPAQVEYKIKEILPRELSGYFFFNGERIDKMSKEIQSGRSMEFADAVKRLLGLDTYAAALRQLRGDRAGKTTVIGYYNSQYDSSSDSRIGQYTREIERKEAELTKIQTRKAEIEDSLPRIEKEIRRLHTLIMTNRRGEELRSQIISKRDRISLNNGYIGSSTADILQVFHRDYKFYFYKKLMLDALTMLSENEVADKGIPDIHARTIEFLLKRGTCICGTPIAADSPEHQALMELLNYIPPKSLGTLIGEFVKDCKARSGAGEDLYAMISKRLGDLKSREEENQRLEADIQGIEESLKQFQDIGQDQQKLSAYEKDSRMKQSELAGINQQIGALTKEIERMNTERGELSLKNDNNRRVELYKAYAERIHAILQEDYAIQETRVRDELESCINEIFKQIYAGGFELRVDEKYNVTTIATGYSEFNENVETSTAQSISIIFAFIAGVIKMARSNEDNDMLSTEAYPLVMDAPLSAFDKTRIQTVCDTLPNIAEQVIIFIKDTDGEIAEKYLSAKIGKSYLFDKKNEFETYLSER